MALRRAFGATRPPEAITQEAFEFDSRHLKRLVRLPTGQRPNPEDLFAYMEDLRYTEIQASLFAYLLPVCLETWRDDLLGVAHDYGGVVENFYPVLADRQVFNGILNTEQSVVVADFMKKTILEEIDNQRGLAFRGSRARPYRWIREFTTYGVLLTDIESLWAEWWEVRTVGRAVAAIQYISCLMYPVNENPIFAPWTANAGGGPPQLWEFAGHLYEHRWLEPNIVFLRQFLRAARVGEVLARATLCLADEPEHAIARQVLSDYPICEGTAAARCTELCRNLEIAQPTTRPLVWSR